MAAPPIDELAYKIYGITASTKSLSRPPRYPDFSRDIIESMSAVGAIWFIYLLGYNISIAVWGGLIALMGLDAETGVFMLLFLDMAYDERVRKGKMKTYEDLEEAIIHGTVKRIRPKMMTVCAILIGLIPIMWSMGTGADMMKRIAAPMIGGVFTSFALELLVYPAIYAIWKWRFEMKHQNSAE